MGFFDKKYPKSFGVYRKSSTFAPAKRNKDVLLSAELGYGVMVTLQILVLSFLVRVRVPQLKNPANRRDFLFIPDSGRRSP